MVNLQVKMDSFFPILLLLSPFVLGDVLLYNNCNNTVYSWTYGPAGMLQSGSIPPHTLYSESYYIYPWNGSGISIKLAAENDVSSPLTQLEYSFQNDSIWYDLSNVNCGITSQGGQASKGDCPFLNRGMYLTTNDSQCTSVSCPSGGCDCTEVYCLPSDNWAAKTCAFDYQNLILYMCQGGQTC